MKKKLLSMIAFSSLFASFSFGQTTFLDEDFDLTTPGTVPAGWTVNGTGLPETWQVLNSYNGNSDLDGTPFLMIDSDAAGSGSNMNDTITFNVPGTAGAPILLLEFDEYHRYCCSSTATLQVYDGIAWQTIATNTGTTTGAWGTPQAQSYDVTAHNNADFKVRFIFEGSWAYWWAIDNVIVREILCPELSNLNQVALLNDTLVFDFQDPDAVGQFDVEWGPVGFAPGMGQEQGAFATTNTQDSVLNFPLGTNWELYVRTNCGGGNTGDWLGPLPFFQPFCTDVTNLTQVYLSEDTLVYSFDPVANAINYHMEYGATGFDPGMGEETGTTSSLLTQDTIFGFGFGTIYDLYVQSECPAGLGDNWVGPITWGLADPNIGYLVWDSTCTRAFEDISSTGEALGLSDDGEVGKTLPFAFQLESGLSSEISIGNNGGIVFGTLTGNVWAGGDVTTADDGFYAFWDDLDTETGDVYYEIRGTAPNRRAIVQWHQRPHYPGPGVGNITFQAILSEGTNEISFVYDDVIFNNPSYDYGASANVGVAGPDNSYQVIDQSPDLRNGMAICYSYVTCPPVDDLTITNVTTDSVFFTITPRGNETEWTIEYGPAPLTPGTGMYHTSTTTTDTIPGLDQYTEYEMYITSSCNANDSSTAVGPYMFETLPVCPAPTNFQVDYVVSDTAIFSWNNGGTETMWTVEYGIPGFTPGSGTTAMFDTNPDTLLGLMDGQVYDFYIYADCGGGTNNPFDGPISVATPVLNDSTCDAIDVVLDSAYSFSNIGATIQTGETKGTGSQAYATVWFKFVSPASGKVNFDFSNSDFDTYVTVYSVTDCDDLSTFTMEDYSDPSQFEMCGLSPSTIYYIQVDGWGGADQGIIEFELTDLEVEAGTAGTAEVCAGDMLDLSTTISGADMGGMWTETNPMLGAVSGSNYNSSEFQAAGMYQVEYRVMNVCGYDSVLVDVTVAGPSNAGIDGTISQECNFGTVNLFDGLSGTVDLGGTWYDYPANNPIIGSQVDFNGEAAGSYYYNYVVSNGICPADTATTTIDLIDCTSLEENEGAEAISLYPNPTSGIVYINNQGNEDKLNIEVSDINGKIMFVQNINLNQGEVFELDLNTQVKGIYFIRVRTESGIGQHKVIVE